jgi:hypothetical protein
MVLHLVTGPPLTPLFIDLYILEVAHNDCAHKGDTNRSDVLNSNAEGPTRGGCFVGPMVPCDIFINCEIRRHLNPGDQIIYRWQHPSCDQAVRRSAYF